MSTPSAILAERTLRSLGMWKIPVDVFELARKEGIYLSPGHYGGECFDGRIEYYSDLEEFCIFHEEARGSRTEGRVRFTIAHELGHYFLPEHREKLRQGAWHNSVADFASRDPREVEADEFAADLLMPMELFRHELRRFRLGWCDLDDLFTLANRLGTSVTSTARRYCESDCEPCTIFFSMDGLIRWNRFSEDMKLLGMYFYPFDTAPPVGSKTAEFWKEIQAGSSPEKMSGPVSSEVWFKWPKRENLWEEVASLGATGRVITQLTPDE
jgi:Zn-dependent peptidase ImmA (M78 family)